MMKENSPICASANPVMIAIEGGSPIASDAPVTPTIFPTTTTPLSTSTAGQYCASRLGSIIIPTETKKTAPKMSRIGATRCSTVAP